MLIDVVNRFGKIGKHIVLEHKIADEPKRKRFRAHAYLLVLFSFVVLYILPKLNILSTLCTYIFPKGREINIFYVHVR